MGRPATKECQRCHYRHSVTEMHKTNTKVNSGQSGTGFSFNPQRSKSIRVNSGRKYYRNKTIWICDDCWPSHQTGKAFGGIMRLMFMGLIIWGLYELVKT